MKTRNANVGPGGINCPCCRPLGGKKAKSKAYVSRAARRAARETSKAIAKSY